MYSPCLPSNLGFRTLFCRTIFVEPCVCSCFVVLSYRDGLLCGVRRGYRKVFFRVGLAFLELGLRGEDRRYWVTLL